MAAVIGIPDPYWGENVGAFIQRAKTSKSESQITRKDLKIWLRSRVGLHKIPERFFWVGEEAGVPNEFPVNATGKIVKTDLRVIASKLVQSNTST